MEKKIISIIIPTFGHPQSIDNLLTDFQKYQKSTYVKILISENQPNCFESELVCSKYKSALDISYIRQKKNLGAITNFYFLTREVQTKYFILLGDDDFLNIDKLVDSSFELDNISDAVLYFGQINLKLPKSDLKTNYLDQLNSEIDIVKLIKNVNDTKRIVKDNKLVNGKYNLVLLSIFKTQIFNLIADEKFESLLGNERDLVSAIILFGKPVFSKICFYTKIYNEKNCSNLNYLKLNNIDNSLYKYKLNSLSLISQLKLQNHVLSKISNLKTKTYTLYRFYGLKRVINQILNWYIFRRITILRYRLNIKNRSLSLKNKLRSLISLK